MTDLPVWPHDYLWKSYRNAPEFRIRLIEKTRALVAFMNENGLLQEPIHLPEEIPFDFCIKESYLSELGRRLFDDLAFDRWMRANEDTMKPLSMISLQRSVRKLQGK